MTVSLITVVVSAFAIILMAAGDEDMDADMAAEWYASICGQNEAFVEELTVCFQYMPERVMMNTYDCMDKYAPSAGRQLSGYFIQMCQDTSLYSKMVVCFLSEDQDTMEQWDPEGRSRMNLVECVRSLFEKYAVEF